MKGKNCYNETHELKKEYYSFQYFKQKYKTTMLNVFIKCADFKTSESVFKRIKAVC